MSYLHPVFWRQAFFRIFFCWITEFWWNLRHIWMEICPTAASVAVSPLCNAFSATTHTIILSLSHACLFSGILLIALCSFSKRIMEPLRLEKMCESVFVHFVHTLQVSKMAWSNSWWLNHMAEWWWMTCISSMSLLWTKTGPDTPSFSWSSAQIGPGCQIWQLYIYMTKSWITFGPAHWRISLRWSIKYH